MFWEYDETDAMLRGDCKSFKIEEEEIRNQTEKAAEDVVEIVLVETSLQP